jgi:hypothetical protein
MALREHGTTSPVILLFSSFKLTVMAKPALNFSRLSIGARILRIRQIVKATTGNSVYTTPSPTLATITAAVDQLEDDQLALKTSGSSATTIRNAQNKFVMGLMNEFVAYVTLESGGDQIKIESTSLAIKKPPKRLGKMPQVTDLGGITGICPGDVILKWKLVKGKRYYFIQKSADGMTNWKNEGEPCTKAKATITGLVTETASYFRVAAGNILGLGQYSKPIRVMAK